MEINRGEALIVSIQCCIFSSTRKRALCRFFQFQWICMGHTLQKKNESAIFGSHMNIHGFIIICSHANTIVGISYVALCSFSTLTFWYSIGYFCLIVCCLLWLFSLTLTCALQFCMEIRNFFKFIPHLTHVKKPEIVIAFVDFHMIDTLKHPSK